MEKSRSGLLPILFILSIIIILIGQFPVTVTSAVIFTRKDRQTTIGPKFTSVVITGIPSETRETTTTLFIHHPRNDPWFFQTSNIGGDGTFAPIDIPKVQFTVDDLPTAPQSSVTVTRNTQSLFFSTYIYSSSYSFKETHSTSPNSLTVDFSLPRNLSYCIVFSWVDGAGTLMAEPYYCRPGQEMSSAAFQPFPTTIVPGGATGQYSVRIGGLDGFADPDSRLHTLIGFGFTTDSATAAPAFIGPAVVYDFDPDQGSIIKRSVSITAFTTPEATGIRFTSPLPTGSSAAVEFIITFAQDPAKTINSWVKVTPVMLDAAIPSNPVMGSLDSYEYEFGYGYGAQPGSVGVPNQRITILGGEISSSQDVIENSPYFTNTPKRHLEVKWTIKVSASTLEQSTELETSTIYLSVPAIFDNDMAWLGCDLVEATTGAVAGTRITTFYGSTNRNGSIGIRWNDSTSMIFSCTASYSLFAQQLSKVSKTSGNMFDFYATIVDNRAHYRFSSAIPIIELSANGNGVDNPNIPLFDNNPVLAPQVTLEPYIYGWDSSNLAQYTLQINSNHLSPLSPDTFRLEYGTDIMINAERSVNAGRSVTGTTYYQWGSSSPENLNIFSATSSAPQALVPGSTTFSLFFSLDPYPHAIYVSTVESLTIGVKYWNPPQNKGDDIVLSNRSSSGQTTTPISPTPTNPPGIIDFACPRINIQFNQDGIDYYKLSNPVIFAPIHLPNFAVSWPVDTPIWSFPKTQNTFDLVFTLFEKPYYFPSSIDEYNQLPDTSVWKSYPNTAIYPGTILEIVIALAVFPSDTRIPIGFGQSQTIPGPFFTSPARPGYQLIEQDSSLGIVTLKVEYQGTFIDYLSSYSQTKLTFTILGDGIMPPSAILSSTVTIYTRSSPTFGTMIPQRIGRLELGTDKRSIGRLAVLNNHSSAPDHAEEWGPIGETVQSVSDIYISTDSLTRISYTPLPDLEVDSVKIGIELWHYPILITSPLTFSTVPKKSQTVKDPEEPLAPGTTLSVRLGGELSTRGYSRVFYRVFTTVKLVSGAIEATVEDGKYFFNIVQKCLSPTADPSKAFTIEGFTNSCTEPKPICPNSGICLATSTGGNVDPPSDDEESNLCNQCDINNTIQCDSNNKTTPCECKTGFTGKYCKEAVECEEVSNKQCNRKNGFTELIPGGTCDVKCTCYDKWQGLRCTSCGLQCLNSGIPYNDCARCGCTTGFSGATCGCKTTQGKITIRAINEVLATNEPLFTPLKQSQLLSVTQSKIFNGYQYPFELNEVDNQIVEMGRELYIEFATELLGNKNAKISFDLSTSVTPPSLSTTTFEFLISFGCTDSNNDLKDLDILKQYWNTFSGKFIKLSTIQKYFEVNFDTNIETDDLIPIPETLPPEDEQLPGNSTTFVSYGFIFYIFILFTTF